MEKNKAQNRHLGGATNLNIVICEGLRNNNIVY